MRRIKDHLTKISPVNIKPKKNKEILPHDELKAEKVGYANQYVERCRYVFENDKAIACYMEMESDNKIFLEPFPLSESLEKNVKYEGNRKYYEWSDEYFEQKGKGCSKPEIEEFMKALGFKIIK